MRAVGEACLLLAFVASGYATFACIAGSLLQRRGLVRAGAFATGICLLALTGCMGVLAHALFVKDFSFQYVSQYSSVLLPWHYSLSALWVGQAGSLLLWAWLLALLAVVFGLMNRQRAPELWQPATGFVLANVCFLVTTMVFGADPMEASAVAESDGLGLSPLLQHPAMLIHPPVVFLGYAAWAFPCALALSALLAPVRKTEEGRAVGIDVEWVRMARPWALFAWAVLGSGILIGANWSYEELGWGGYWAWDPVENGSLIPWLTGTVFLHGLMCWQFRGILKKWTLGLAIATFGLCNFATFLTRSGIFSSLHAFSESPIGWLFLGLMAALLAGGGWLVVRRRRELAPEQPLMTIWSRESQILISAVALLLMALVAVLGTLSVALSDAFIGRRIVVGTAFYNNVLIPVGLILLLTTALAPLLRWGRVPTSEQRRALMVAAVFGLTGSGAALAAGVRHPLGLAVSGLSGFAIAALAGALWLDARRAGLGAVLVARRRQYVGFLIHLGFVSLAIGITGSALGSQRHEVVLTPGETIEWAGRSISFAGLRQSDLPDKFVAEAELEVTRAGADAVMLRPAQHLHRLQNEWTTEVAIHSDWSGDFYTILHNGEADDGVRLTLVDTPLMRWMWLGGWVMGIGAVLALCPDGVWSRSRSANKRVVTRNAVKPTLRRRPAVSAREAAGTR